ncbi:MAG TPA: hypothetical protein VHQ65_07875, partial [Thermoanaerobaculia bacterium]|nr:hypothetical protein [Thermoanaerobaculia bacterium]
MTTPTTGEAEAPPLSDRQHPAPEPGSAAAAAAVVRDYYAAVAAGDHRRADRLWGGGGAASGQTLEEMRAGSAQTVSVRAEVGTPGRVEPAAGSRYVRVPVTVRATTRSGEPQCFAGNYVLRRSVVPGATAEQRTWRIHSADLTPCPGAGPAVASATGTVAGDELPAAAVPVAEATAGPAPGHDGAAQDVVAGEALGLAGARRRA